MEVHHSSGQHTVIVCLALELVVAQSSSVRCVTGNLQLIGMGSSRLSQGDEAGGAMAPLLPPRCSRRTEPLLLVWTPSVGICPTRRDCARLLPELVSVDRKGREETLAQGLLENSRNHEPLRALGSPAEQSCSHQLLLLPLHPDACALMPQAHICVCMEW